MHSHNDVSLMQFQAVMLVLGLGLGGLAIGVINGKAKMTKYTVNC